MILDKVRIQVSKTAQGNGDYCQVLSSDGVSLNVVVVAKEIVVNDARQAKPSKRKASK